jgi:ABC-2 type transport system ATP-binding protein
MNRTESTLNPRPADPRGCHTGGVVDTPLLRAAGLTKRYRGGVVALDGLSVEVPRGLVGLVGANGAGKTTLFRLLLGLTHPTEGRVEVCGHDVTADPVAARGRLGYMPEHECLPLDQTAADVVSTLGEVSGLPPRAARQRASEVLDLVGLDEARFRSVGGFSTGMRQRVKLAQALVSDPELALLDEPTAGLDPTGREEMLALVARLGTFGISVLLATHLLDDVARVCDHVVMLDAGRLVVAGTTDSLLERTGTVTVDVGDGAAALAGALAARGVPAVVDEVLVEVTVRSDDDLDVIRDVVVELGLPLHRLSSRAGSLDEAFLMPRPATSLEVM